MYNQYGMQPNTNHFPISYFSSKTSMIIPPSQMLSMSMGFPTQNGNSQIKTETQIVQNTLGHQAKNSQVIDIKTHEFMDKIDEIIQGLLQIHPKKCQSQKGANIFKDIERIKEMLGQLIGEAKSIPVQNLLNMEYTNYLMYIAELHKQILQAYNSLILLKQKGEFKGNQSQARQLKIIVDYVCDVLVKEVEEIEKGVMDSIKKQTIKFDRRTQESKQVLKKDCFKGL